MILHDVERNGRERILFLLCSLLLAFMICGFISDVTVRAASGNVYTCTINRSYSHPITGSIEDSGGSSSTATGQGMVEGCVADSGLLELTDDGEYYLTFRLGLADYTSKHTFSVQTMGDSSFQSVDYEQTGSGSDDNGKTIDYRVKVPSESCIVRCTMYVDPMGRDVIFYLYPSNYSVGNTTDMKATVVTESSTENVNADAQGSTESASSGTQAGFQDSSETKVADNSQTSSSEDDSLNDSQGLSLSTASDEATDSDNHSDSSDTMSPLTLILCVVLAFTISGLILILVTAYIVYYFRKNWKRWGGGKIPQNMEDSEEDSYFAPGFGSAEEDDSYTSEEIEFLEGDGKDEA